MRNPFAKDFRTITFDYRGTGASRPAGEAWADWATWSSAVFAADAVAVLPGLGLDQASVYGTSMGGRIGQLLALEHRPVVDRLVLACTSMSPDASRGHLRVSGRHAAFAAPRRAPAPVGPCLPAGPLPVWTNSERGTHVPTTRCASRAH